MRYSPKHAAPAPSSTGRRTVGVIALSAATVGGGLATASSAHAATGSNVWDRVAACESSGNWSINTGNGFYGGLQFTQQTWVGFGGTRYASSAQYASRDQQITIAQAVLRVQGPGAWPVCSVRAGLTRANGAAVVVGGTTTSSTPTTTTTTSRSASRQLVVDGILGPLTSRATQKWVGVSQTGVFDTTTKQALQRKVGVSADGIVGPKTVAALQAKIGISRDGARYLNSRTVQGLQRYLNSHVL